MQIGPREIDYLAYLIDECKLTEWEIGFSKSCITNLRGGKYPSLSQRQRACLDKMVVKYNLAKDEFCVRGYADREMHQVMNETGPGMNPKPKIPDDDIPF